MLDQLRDHLRQLTAIPGISGHEDPIIRYMTAVLKPHAHELRVDALGNVIARTGRGGGPRIAVLAHIDTIGLMVQRPIGLGLFGVVSVGGVNLKALPGAAVQVHTGQGAFASVIGVRSQHLARPGDLERGIDDVYVQVLDAAAPVEITTPVTYAPAFYAADDLISAPYLDNRAGCAVLLEVAARCADLPAEIYLVGTVQEETTGSGAHLALTAIQPDAAIFVDAALSYDTPDTVRFGAVRLGAGPVLIAYLYVSGMNAWHAHPGLHAHLKGCAQAAGISYQQDAAQGIISDARSVIWSGVPSALIGLPTRSKHAPLEMANLRDLAASVDLLLAFLQEPLPNLARG